MITMRRYQYIYAVIDPDQGDMCVQVQDTTVDCSSDPDYIPLDTYNEEYLFKYYDRATGLWYYDIDHTEPFNP